jgi:ubiquinone biosynthesis protein
MKSPSYSEKKEDIKRFNEIVGILAKYGYADWVKADTPDFIKDKFVGPEGQDLSKLPSEVRIRLAITELGTTFIKMGQMMSTRADMVGPELAQELSALQADVPPDPPQVVRETLEAELGQPLEELYATFDLQALSSASIGQVHLATLLDGTEVVVKVQHQGIEKKVKEDLNIIMQLADLAEKHNEELRRYQPKATVLEFRRSLLREMDFSIERSSMETFIRNFAEEPQVHIPQPYPDQSSRRVLTQEKLDGYSVANTDRLAAEEVDTKAIADQGANMYLDMIFRDGFYHADPHPGNIWVLPGGRIGLLDSGKVGRIDPETREQFEDIVQAFAARDTVLLTDEVISLCTVPPDLDRDALQADISSFIDENLVGDVDDFDMSAIINGGVDIIRGHQLVLPPKVNMLLKVLVQLEGTSRTLDTSFNLSGLLQAYQQKTLVRRLSPERLVRRIYRTYKDWDRLLTSLPRDLSVILERIQSGQLHVQMELRGLDRPMNRMVYGLVSASLFLGSTILWANNVPPLINDISVLGAAGTILSLVLGLNLIWKIRKSGGLE